MEIDRVAKSLLLGHGCHDCVFNMTAALYASHGCSSIPRYNVVYKTQLPLKHIDLPDSGACEFWSLEH